MCEITQKDFDEVKNAVKQNDRALRGGNSNIGLIAIVELVRNDVTWIRATMEKNNNSNITWRWIVEKLGTPIIVGVVIGIIMLFGS